MNVSFFRIFFSLVPLLLFFNCKPAVIPVMTRDQSLRYDLTSPYEFRDTNNNMFFLYANPVGISIKHTRENSDGSIEVMLGGTNVENGIPDALHEIYYPPVTTTPTIIPTDYPIAGYINLPALPPVPGTPRPLENSFALGPASKNSKYTVVTISGMVQHDGFIQIREENESLRLLTEYYIDGYNARSALFNPNRKPMLKDIVYYQDPNLFSDSGFNPARRIFRGRQEQQGGFNVLIWDGAEPRRATYQISYDGGKTFKRTVVDWTNVKFAEKILTNLQWTDDPGGIVNSSYKPFNTLAGTPPDYTVSTSISQYLDPDEYPPISSIAEGLQPVFTPANATNKNFYYDDGAGGKIYSQVYTGTYATIELADRVRASAIKNAGAGTDTVKFIADVETTPGSPPTTVTLTISVTVTP